MNEFDWIEEIKPMEGDTYITDDWWRFPKTSARIYVVRDVIDHDKWGKIIVTECFVGDDKVGNGKWFRYHEFMEKLELKQLISYDESMWDDPKYLNYKGGSCEHWIRFGRTTVIN